jgi:hypothetical protein
MDTLEEIIRTFSLDDIKDFKTFVNRQRKIKERKDYELFDYLLKHPGAKQHDIIQTIYGKNNVEAYHGLRKYLTRQIMQFIMVKQLQDDQSVTSGIAGLLSLTRYLFGHKSYKIAWKYLKKAEDQALFYELYEQLQQVYNMEIAFSDTPYAPDLKDIIAKHQLNKLNAGQDERTAIAFAIIREQVNRYKHTGENIKFEQIIKQMIESYDLEQDIYSRPKLFYQVMSVFRSAVIAKKDYYSFEPFLLGYYRKFLVKKGFKPKDNEYKAGILYMIAQTMYRNKKFEDASNYLDQFKEVLEQMPQIQANDLLNKYYLLRSAISFFTGNINEAVELLQSVCNSASFAKNIIDTLNLKLNLGLYHLYNKEPQMANKVWMSVAHTNKWLEKIMGIEWVLKKDLLEMIVQYDLGNDDIALSKIRSIERTYDMIKGNEQYQRVLVYLQLCREIFMDPAIAKTKEFYDHVDVSFDWVPMQQEDLQAVMYYAWFKAQMTGEDRYEILQALIKVIE